MKKFHTPRFYLLFLFVTILPLVSISCELGKNWKRHTGAVLRSPIGFGYEVAGDPHAFQTPTGEWRMVYSADDKDQISIRLAKQNDNGEWDEGPVLLGPSKGHNKPFSKETAFYRLSSSGEHQIYFIGYEDEKTYQSEVYLAVSDQLEGPYKILPDPVISRGRIAGRHVYLITSPSIIDVGGQLAMTFLGWDDFENVTEVWSFVAISKDDGRTWSGFRDVEIPIGMEGQITKTPDGRFAAVRTGEYEGSEAIFIACSNDVFGPYLEQEEPILIQQGPPWEVDEIIAPSLAYDSFSKQPTLFYVGADHRKGWWVMSAEIEED